MSDNSSSPKPTEIGRRALRELTIALIAVVGLLTASLVWMAAFDVRASGAFDNWMLVLGIAAMVLSVLFVLAPGVVFLRHAMKHRAGGISTRLRFSATGSAVAPGLLGALLISIGEAWLVAGGTLLVLFAGAVVTLAWSLPTAEPTTEAAVLRDGYAWAGLLLVALIAFGSQTGHDHPPPYRTAMKSDLRNLVSQQEQYFEQHKRYTTDLVALDFRWSTGVSAPKVVVGPDWWLATNTHERLAGVTCGIAVNTTNPVLDSVPQGEPVCK